MKYIILSILLLTLTISLRAQVVYEHLTNTNIYNYLDEMANLRIIQINSIIKPYSREMIYNKLTEVESYNKENPNKLSKRQQQELKFYRRAYALEAKTSLPFPAKTDLFKKNTALATALNPPGLFYKDSVITMAIQPIIGASYSSNVNGSLTHTWGGASFFGYIGNNLGFYTSVRDNNESLIMMDPAYFVQKPGVPFKNFGSDGVDYTEARGGINYSWKWGNIGFVKDHVEWGTGYNGTNIQSGHTPSFAMIKLNLKPVKWFDFNYYHGWLTSDVVDSSRSYWTNNTYRIVYYQKYMASNMFTFYPFKGFNVSIGNSIVYTNENGGGPIAAYLIPFLFYKSVDITLSSYEKYGYASNNNQFFFNLSSRNIKHLHLYFSLFADDISTRYFFNDTLYNSFSYKIGFRLSDYLIRNMSFTFEYTRTNPYVYQHHSATQDYTSNSYNMGHYLRANSDEIFIAADFRPIRGLSINLAYIQARHGDAYDINDPEANVHSDPILKNIIWQNQQIQFSARYEIVANSYVFGIFNYQNITGDQTYIEKYTPEYYWGETSTFRAGINVGF